MGIPGVGASRAEAVLEEIAFFLPLEHRAGREQSRSGRKKSQLMLGLESPVARRRCKLDLAQKQLPKGKTGLGAWENPEKLPGSQEEEGLLGSGVQ